MVDIKRYWQWRIGLPMNHIVKKLFCIFGTAVIVLWRVVNGGIRLSPYLSTSSSLMKKFLVAITPQFMYFVLSLLLIVHSTDGMSWMPIKDVPFVPKSIGGKRGGLCIGGKRGGLCAGKLISMSSGRGLSYLFHYEWQGKQKHCRHPRLVDCCMKKQGHCVQCFKYW